jgi:prepilin-type processing-associated H-X9-DG protein
MPRLVMVAMLAALTAPARADAPADLKGVPKDAAVFVHVAVAKLWAGPVGQQLRDAKYADADRYLGEFTALTGLTPADVTSVSMFVPDFRTPTNGPFENFGAHFTLAKPIDVGRVAALAVVARHGLERELDVAFDKGVLTLTPSKRQNNNGLKFQAVADFRDPLHPTVLVSTTGTLKAMNSGTTPLADALEAAATKDLVVAVNFNAFPPEIREDKNQSPGVRPFLPIVKADVAFVVGEVTGQDAVLTLRLRSSDAATVRDAEKSLGALRTLLTDLPAGAAKQAAKSKSPGAKEVVTLLTGISDAVAKADIKIAGTDAVATLKLPTDLPVAKALAASYQDASQKAGTRLIEANNLKQIGLAMHNYESVNNSFPPPFTVGKKGKPLLSWRVAVLPYLEQNDFYTKFKLDEPWDSEHNLKVVKDNPMPKVFALPGVTKDGEKETYYRVLVGNGAAFEKFRPQKILDFTDGTSNTILVATAANAVPWTKPEELDFDPKLDAKKLFKFDGDLGGCNVLFADGSVHFLKATIDAANLNGIITRAGGEVVNIE